MARYPQSGAESGDASSEIDLRAVGKALKRRHRIYLLPTLLAMVLVGIYVILVTPRYTAQSQILLENQETFFTRPDRTSQPSEAAQLDEVAVASQVQLIASPDLARRAIAKLKLVGDDEFDPSAHPGPVTRVLQLLHLAPEPSRDAVEQRTADAFGQKLTVYSPPKTRVVTLEFTSRDPALAARAANTVAELYIAEQSAAKRGQARTAAEALSEQIADLRTKLAKADAERERYRSTSGLLAGSNNMTVSGQQVAELNGDLSRARAIQADAQAKASMIRSLLRSGKSVDVAEVTNNEIVRRIWDQRATAQAQLALESRTLLPGHPHIKELRAQVEGFDVALKGAARQAASTLENEAQIAGARVANLETVLTQQKTAAGVANGDEVHLRALERVAQGFKEQLESSTTKYEEALARQSSTATPADARIISRAVTPQLPSFPKKLPFVLFATLATLVFSLSCVVAAELLSGRALAGPVSPVEMALPVAPSFSLPQSRRAQGILRDDAVRPPPVERTGAPRRRPVLAEPAAMDPPIKAPAVKKWWAGTRAPGRTMPPTSAAAGLSPAGSGTSKLSLDAAARVLFAYLRRFGQSAEQSGRHEGHDASGDVFPPPDPRPVTSAIVQPVERDETVEAVPDDFEATLEALAQRIAAAHVPGRGLHIVGTGVGDGRADQLIALSRHLSAKGRGLIVDLGTMPARLGSLVGAGSGQAEIGAMAGLSELLAGDASFAEVIHRDCASRLHFIPTGAMDADFRDFDLILDALSETYDFIMLLTPSFPQSEIAKVMAPYADMVVLAAAKASDRDVLHLLEAEMVEAGARDVLIIDSEATPARDVA